jgi:molybdopterin-guanine dinucleotide biosynthesis protein A
MGRDKAHLPFGRETMLERVVSEVGVVVGPRRIVVAAAEGQVLPPLPPEIRVVRDLQEDCGPMSGLAAGLAAVREEADAVFVGTCDAPLLRAEFISGLFDRLGGAEAVVPVEGDRFYPATAVYRTSVLPIVLADLEAGQFRMQWFARDLRAVFIPIEELRSIDPDLASLRNVNSPEEYLAALDWAGLKPVEGGV